MRCRESGNVQFAGIPNFAPEILRRVRVKDPMKAKHLRKALEGLAEEGVTQLFTPEIGSDIIVGAVGQLQFEVMAERIATENNLEVLFEPAPWAAARWLSSDDRAKLDAFLEKQPSRPSPRTSTARRSISRRTRGMSATSPRRTRRSASRRRKSGSEDPLVAPWHQATIELSKAQSPECGGRPELQEHSGSRNPRPCPAP